jgi:hypothetical protein
MSTPKAEAPEPAASRTKQRNGNGNGNGNGGPGVLATGDAPMKDNNLLYAAGDVIVWAGQPNTGAPIAFEDPSTISAGTYVCLGWVDTSGYIFKLDETIKDIPAAGILTPIRSILTGGSKTVQANLLESMNPWVRSMFDDVPIFPTASSPLMPPTTPVEPMLANQVSYILPDPPADNRYSLIFDSHDGLKQMRLYAPYAKVTARGNDQVQQADIEPLNLTWTMYPGTIDDGTDPAVTGVAKRIMDYGMDMSAYFS